MSNTKQIEALLKMEKSLAEAVKQLDYLSNPMEIYSQIETIQEVTEAYKEALGDLLVK